MTWKHFWIQPEHQDRERMQESAWIAQARLDRSSLPACTIATFHGVQLHAPALRR